MTGFIISVKTEMATMLFEVSLLVIVMVFAKAETGNLVVAFIITDHLCQFFKRFIFQRGPQSHPLYYAVQRTASRMPSSPLRYFSLFRKIASTRVAGSSKLLFSYVGISLLVAALNIRSLSIEAGLGGFYQGFMLLCALFVGTQLPLSIFSKIARVLSVLILVSVPYGVYQFFVGLDRDRPCLGRGNAQLFDRGWKSL